MRRDEDLAASPPMYRFSAFWISAAVSALLVALPLLAVGFAPITDLPQQTAQIRLLGEALGGEGGDYRVQAWHPNKLGYLPLALAWLAAPPLPAARLGLLLIALAWVGGVHLLAARTGRRPEAAALASMLFFSHVTYWGLLTFLLGLPAFALFYLAARSRGRWGPLLLAAAAALLYSAHILWLGAGLLWLLAQGWRARLQPREWAGRALAVAPVVAAALLWYPTLARGEFDSETVWGQSLIERLDPRWLLGSAFGGLQGPAEPLLAAALAAWVLLGLWQSRHRTRRAIHTDFLLLAALCGILALALPAVHQGTVLFASRWVPIAAVFALLGLPTPKLRIELGLALAFLLLCALTTTTTIVWDVFEREELSGLAEAVAGLPANQRVLGLDLVRQSPRIQGFPFYHLYAYGQVAKGGTLNRSFANFASSLVVFRDLPREHPWTYGLDWKPQNLRQSDIPHFDYLIVHGDEAVHALFGRDPKLRRITPGGRWRLYRVAAEVTADAPGEDAG